MKNLSNKIKFYLVLAIAVLLLLLSFNLALKPTFNQANTLAETKQKIEKAKSAPEKIQVAEKQLQEMKEIVGSVENDYYVFQEQLLNTVVALSATHNVKIQQVKEPHVATINDYEVQTILINLKGGFSSITKVLDAFERKKNLGKISSVSYDLIQNKRLKVFILEASIYVQNFKKKRVIIL